MNATANPSSVHPDTPLGRIAVDLPGATAVFRRLKLDFCCGGHVSLGDACAARGLDAGTVVDELAALVHDDGEPVPEGTAALIDYILQRFHEVHRKQLPELTRMARRVEAVHRGHPEVPAGLGDFLVTVGDELLAHMAKEEAILFPLLRQGGYPLAVHPIAAMRAEHTDHGARLERLAALTHGHVPPAEACNTWRALYAGTQQLTEDLFRHIHLENNCLFPRFEAA